MFGKEKLQFLGYEVSQEGISPVQKKVEALRNFPTPVKQKQLLAFLGSLNYYRAVHTKPRTPAQILEPLYKLATCEIPKKSSFEAIWNNSENIKKAYEDAKVLLEKAITLNF